MTVAESYILVHGPKAIVYEKGGSGLIVVGDTKLSLIILQMPIHFKHRSANQYNLNGEVE